jgi:hypothetical protein
MTASVSLSVFHQWLLADPASQTSACAIVLHIADSRPCDLLIQEITDYLNEYDDDGDGRWLPASPLLVEKISHDANHRRLLGLSEVPAARTDDADSETRNTLTALGQRGHVVFRSPGLSDDELGLANAFHAGVGSTGEITGECHLILNPELMDQSCIAHVIGDVFLEWLHWQSRHHDGIRDIR